MSAKPAPVGVPWLQAAKRKAVGTLFLVAAVFSCVAFARAWWSLVPPSDHPGLYVRAWQLGAPQEQRMRRFLSQVDRLVPRGQTVVLRASSLESIDQITLLAWCSFLLPRHEVVLAPAWPHPERPSYLISYPPGEPSEMARVVEEARLASVEADLMLHGDPAALFRLRKATQRSKATP